MRLLKLCRGQRAVVLLEPYWIKLADYLRQHTDKPEDIRIIQTHIEIQAGLVGDYLEDEV